MEVVRAEWKARTLAEYRAASMAGELLTWLVRLGFSSEATQAAYAVVGHELDHADLCWEVYGSVGGKDDPMAVAEGSLVIPHAFGEPTFDRLLLFVLDTYCIAETLAGPLFKAMTERATDSACNQAVRRLADDTLAHASFGWMLLDEAIEQDGQYVLALGKKNLPAYLARVERAWGHIPEDYKEPVGPEEGAYGLIPRAVYKRCFYQVIAEKVLPELDARNLPGREAWSKRPR